jgi:hypothetical protein
MAVRDISGSFSEVTSRRAIKSKCGCIFGCDIFSARNHSDLFSGGGSTVKVERREASNTFTARTEP